MKKFYLYFWGIIAMLLSAANANATGWPANFQGVMLQGFYWNSNNETSWAQLTSKADDLAKSFKLIWVPNSAKSSGMPAMGYMPIFWFTNHNSSFGTQDQLKTMISTFKDKGVGIIEDVVINHRVGERDWYDFPSETWRGKTYHLTNGAICSSDEMWREGGHGCPYTRGGADTGDDFNGARDLDHNNATVQEHIKDYCKFLIEDLGYVGFRLDMVKGYAGKFTKMYNQYSHPTYSVGEYWEDNYDAIAAWIESTGKESAAFDFPFKYAVNKAFSSGDMTQLVWKANGTTPQPAGLIHYGYPQYAVTFVENHDTYENGSKFNGNVVAANAFMLCSPGTPCVFWPHYTQNKAAIEKLIAARNDVGIHNLSTVEVLRTTNDCYMAEVTGTKGKLVVKIGPAMVSPTGYSDSQIVASGQDYCVWSTKQGGITPDPDPVGEPFNVYFKNTKGWTTPYVHYWGNTESDWPGVKMTVHKGDVWVYTVPAGTTGLLFNAGDGDNSKTNDFVAQKDHLYTPDGDAGVYDENEPENPDTPFDIYFDNTNSNWAKPHIHHWGKTESVWPGVEMSVHNGNVWVYTVPAGTTGILFNAGDGDDSKTNNFVAKANHVYTTSGDQGVYSGSDNPGNYPQTLYLIGNINGKTWDTLNPLPATGNNGVYNWSAVQFDNAGDGSAYFSFITTTGTSWDVVNEADRYGSEAYTEGKANTDLTIGVEATIIRNPVNVSASGATSWKLTPGKYDVTANLSTMKVKVSNQSGVEETLTATDAPVEYFNLQGVRVNEPAAGLYIRRQGNNVTKVYIK